MCDIVYKSLFLQDCCHQSQDCEFSVYAMLSPVHATGANALPGFWQGWSAIENFNYDSGSLVPNKIPKFCTKDTISPCVSCCLSCLNNASKKSKWPSQLLMCWYVLQYADICWRWFARVIGSFQLLGNSYRVQWLHYPQVSNEKNLVVLGIQGIILHSCMGIVMNHYKDPS